MDKRHQLIKDNFNQSCKKHGMVEFPTAPLLTDDKTVYYASATITPLKEILASGQIPTEGLFLHQPCFRLKYIDEPFYNGSKIRYPGYFNMLGTLVQPKNILDLQEVIIQIIDDQDIPHDKVKIDVSDKDKFLVKKLKDKYKIEYNLRSDSSYQWTYGMGENISGRGLTLLLQQDNGEYKRIGQYIAISDNGKLISCEYGVGIEVMLARKEQYENEYDAFSIASILQQNKLAVDFANTHIFSSVASAYGAGITMDKYPRKGYKKGLNRMLTNLLLLKIRDGLSDEQIMTVSKRFMITEFGNAVALSNLMHDFKTKESELNDQIVKASAFAKNQQRLGRTDDFISQRISDMYPLYTTYNDMFKSSR
ncbi:MAG: hypothetical protein LBF37_03040 [Rickettsiales bacterium]|jgi:hypothetical protein|nr:hypothetical protein [Rickettsiales bacterium]